MEEMDTSDILTFDELLEDDYYRSEFEKRLQQEIDIKNSHSDVKGGIIMENIQQPSNGEIIVASAAPTQAEVTPQVQAKPLATRADNPAAKPTNANTQEDALLAAEPATEMTAEQFELYNETLRKVSKTAKTDLNTRYNAFEDAEVKASIKAQILAGEKPAIKDIAASVVTRLTPKAESHSEQNPSETDKPKQSDEVALLKAELALLKAGIIPERIEAAKKLFLAEGGDSEKAAEFVAKYPEWKGVTAGITLHKAPPVAGKTAPNPANQPVYNDFERKVAAARKKAGLN